MKRCLLGKKQLAIVQEALCLRMDEWLGTNKMTIKSPLTIKKVVGLTTTIAFLVALEVSGGNGLPGVLGNGYGQAKGPHPGDGDSEHSFILVQRGKPNAILVIPDKPTVVVGCAAKELNSYVKAVTGVLLPIVKESAVTDKLLKGNTIMSIGPTKFADRIGLSAEHFAYGEFICRGKDGIIAIFGKDNNKFERDFGVGANGNWNGMCRFVEKFLGVRWLWPGQIGMVVPSRKTLVISLKEDFSEKPQIRGRRVRDRIYLKCWKDDWAKIGVDEKRWREMARSTYRWQKFLLKGGEVDDIPGGHGFTGWWDMYHKGHPDWFAMQLDGTRNPPIETNFCAPSTVKLCVSNPEVAHQVVLNAIEHYKKSKEIFRAGINDNANVGVCVCEKCRAYDFPKRASSFVYRYRSGKLDYCYITDRYVAFWNRIGKEFEERSADKHNLISVSAYGCITEPPVRNSIKYSNILLAYTGFEYLNDKMNSQDRVWWQQWSERTVGKMSLRTNNLVCGYGFPYFYGRELAKDFNQLFAGKLYTIENEALFCYFATNGINYYILYKLMWNPQADVEKIIDDFCEKGFGEAAPEIKRYYNELEKLTKEVASHNWQWRGPFLKGLPTIYTQAKISELREILKKAKAKVSGDYARRVDFLEEGLDYAEVTTAVLRAKTLGGSKEEISEALKARDRFFKHQKYLLSVPYPADMNWRRYNPRELGD